MIDHPITKAFDVWTRRQRMRGNIVGRKPNGTEAAQFYRETSETNPAVIGDHNWSAVYRMLAARDLIT